MTEYTYFTAPSGTAYRLHLEQDIDAESPRENDCNIATLITFDARYNSPDGKLCADRYHRTVHSPFPGEYAHREGVDVRRMRKYAALFMPEILTVTGLDHRGLDGTLAITEGDHAIGVAFVTREDWVEAMGEDDGIWPCTPLEAIEAEVKDYNNWATGEYVGFVVEQARPFVKTYVGGPSSLGIDWVETDSVWGFDDPEYALDEAKACLPEGSVESDAPETD